MVCLMQTYSRLHSNICFSADSSVEPNISSTLKRTIVHNTVQYFNIAQIQQIIVYESFSPGLMQFELSSVLCSVMPGVDTVEVGL